MHPESPLRHCVPQHDMRRHGCLRRDALWPNQAAGSRCRQTSTPRPRAGSASAILEGGWLGRTGEPYAFSVGRMRRRMPAHALLMLRSGNRMVPVGFNATLHTISQDGLHPEQDDLVFKDAEAAARATADRFRGAGNPASAA